MMNFKKNRNIENFSASLLRLAAKIDRKLNREDRQSREKMRKKTRAMARDVRE